MSPSSSSSPNPDARFLGQVDVQFQVIWPANVEGMISRWRKLAAEHRKVAAAGAAEGNDDDECQCWSQAKARELEARCEYLEALAAAGVELYRCPPTGDLPEGLARVSDAPALRLFARRGEAGRQTGRQARQTGGRVMPRADEAARRRARGLCVECRSVSRARRCGSCKQRERRRERRRGGRR